MVTMRETIPFVIQFTLNNYHTIDFALKHGSFSRHGLQGFV
jgi:hypothetical protein